MKLQLLSMLCLFALASALVARRPSRRASGLSPSSRINNYGLTARDDDFDICYRGWCYECDRDDRCPFCDDDEVCIRGYCCEFEGKRCKTTRDCYDDDDDDDDDDD